jgi:hypothetical protein
MIRHSAASTSLVDIKSLLLQCPGPGSGFETLQGWCAGPTHYVQVFIQIIMMQLQILMTRAKIKAWPGFKDCSSCQSHNVTVSFENLKNICNLYNSSFFSPSLFIGVCIFLVRVPFLCYKERVWNGRCHRTRKECWSESRRDAGLFDDLHNSLDNGSISLSSLQMTGRHELASQTAGSI